jgi:hypothetical protein
MSEEAPKKRSSNKRAASLVEKAASLAEKTASYKTARLDNTADVKADADAVYTEADAEAAVVVEPGLEQDASFVFSHTGPGSKSAEKYLQVSPSRPETQKKKKSFLKRVRSFFTRKNKKGSKTLTPVAVAAEGSANYERQIQAANTIKRFYKKHTLRSKAIYYNRFCKNPGVCLALGIHAEEIKRHFGGFTDFKYVEMPVLVIGEASVNGFVNQIKYVNDKTITNLRQTVRRTVKGQTLKALSPPASPYKTADYVAYAVLKTAKEKNKDSPLYEYLVGQFINKVNKFYPAFIETYGYYIYKSKDDKANAKPYEYKNNPYLLSLQQQKMDNKNVLKEGLILQPEINTDKELQEALNKSCIADNILAILIQHLKDVETLFNYMDGNTYPKSELVFILYQIYFSLAQLSTQFTHYDLHRDNVLLYKPDKDKYIEYHYHISAPGSKAPGSKAPGSKAPGSKATGSKATGSKATGSKASGSKASGSKAPGSKAHGSKASREEVVVKFKSAYMVKIIDYGRAYFFDSPTNNSATIYEGICKAKECGLPEIKKEIKICGKKKGYAFLSFEKDDKDVQFLSTRFSNMSADLYLLNIIKTKCIRYLSSGNTVPAFVAMLNRLVYKEGYASTEEITPEISKGFPNKICNVLDAEEQLRDLIVFNQDNLLTNNDTMYYDKEKLGELHIYMDGREMQYIESSDIKI